MKKVTDVGEAGGACGKGSTAASWDVEYVREAGQWYLRLYLDKDGGVDILDCEAISRKVSDLLDEADPIESSYVFEVGSAGLERQLKRPGDFDRFMGSPVLVKTYQNRDGRKEFAGKLAGCEVIGAAAGHGRHRAGTVREERGGAGAPARGIRHNDWTNEGETT